VRKIKDSAGQPVVTQQPDTDRILGFRVIPNQDMPLLGASAKSIAFGDFSRYLIRDSMEFAVLRLSERFATQGQVAFIAFMRSDGRTLDAGTNPIKVFQNPAS
jgi:HK97 family phage major capsid protein